MKKLFLLLMAVLTITGTATAQNQVKELTKQQKKELAEAAIMKVERFQRNCATVAGDGDYSEKTSPGGIVDIAMQDFMSNAKIQTTSLDGKNKNSQKVKKYLMKLALLRKNVYKKIQITSYECAMVTGFTKDINKSKATGEEWYTGVVTIIQEFNAITHEGRVVGDKVRRTVEVKAKLNNIYNTDGSVFEYWDVLLNDIYAINIP